MSTHIWNQPPLLPLPRQEPNDWVEDDRERDDRVDCDEGEDYNKENYYDEEDYDEDDYYDGKDYDANDSDDEVGYGKYDCLRP